MRLSDARDTSNDGTLTREAGQLASVDETFDEHDA
jgi:hypothetical protein